MTDAVGLVATYAAAHVLVLLATLALSPEAWDDPPRANGPTHGPAPPPE